MAVSKTKPIEQWQIKKLWAISKALGMDKEDLYATANVSSLHSLTYIQADEVITRLEKLQSNRPVEKAKLSDNSKPVADATHRKVWALMYELQKYDTTQSTASLGDRLCGIIKKEFLVDATPEKPFIWLNWKKINKLIEILKKYVANAKSKTEKGGVV